MADIELVIKIPDHLYKLLKEFPSDSNEGNIENVLMKAVEHGTPLPKGHGKIVDIDKLIHSKCNECGHIKEVSCSIPCYAVRRMLDAPTIIEADKE